jgi:hypothetical protein
MLMPITFFMAADCCKAYPLRATAAATTVSQHRPQAQASAATVASIKELRWVNADSNQRNFVVDRSFIVPINTLPEFAAEALVDEVSPTVQLAMEAIVPGGPFGSVKFTFHNETYIDDTPPYALCKNKGADFLPCQCLNQNPNAVLIPMSGPSTW